MAKQNYPHNQEAERALLGSILLDPSWLDAVPHKITRDDFFSPNHRRIYDAMLRLRAKKRAVDLVTLCEEIAREHGGVEQAGGAGYISALTDGLALGVSSSVHEYMRILRENTHQRQLLNTLQNAASRALQGEDLAILAKSIKAEIEEYSGNGHKPHAEAPSVAGTPKVPKGAWPAMAAEYREVIAPTTNAPDSFHLASFLTAVGAALGRSIFVTISEPIYPSLWTVLVGEAGLSRKGTAMKKATRLVRAAAPELETFRSIDSAEGLAKTLAPIQGKDVDQDKRQPAIFHLSELRTFLDKAGKKGLENLIPRMCEVYDGDPLEGRSVSSPVQVPEPFAAVIAGSSKPYVQSFRRADLEGGFGSRMAFVWGVSKKPIAKPPKPQDPQYSNLIIDLKQAIRFWRDKGSTEFSMTPEADRLWVGFYEEELPKYRPEDDFLRILTNRSEHFAIKVAMIAAALDLKHVIEARHLACGIQFARFCIDSLRFVFDDYDLPRWVRDERAIVEAVKKRPEGIQRRRLHMNFSRLGAEQFNRHIKALCDGDGILIERQVGRKKWLYYAGD